MRWQRRVLRFVMPDGSHAYLRSDTGVAPKVPTPIFPNPPESSEIIRISGKLIKNTTVEKNEFLFHKHACVSFFMSDFM